MGDKIAENRKRVGNKLEIIRSNNAADVGGCQQGSTLQPNGEKVHVGQHGIESTLLKKKRARIFLTSMGKGEAGHHRERKSV